MSSHQLVTVGSKAAGLCSRTLWNNSFRVAYLKSGLKSDWNAAWHDPEQAIRDQKPPSVADLKQEENKAFFFLFLNEIIIWNFGPVWPNCEDSTSLTSKNQVFSPPFLFFFLQYSFNSFQPIKKETQALFWPIGHV